MPASRRNLCRIALIALFTLVLTASALAQFETRGAFLAQSDSIPISSAVGDFNRDGIPDLAVASYCCTSSGVSILIGRGDGTFDPGVAYDVGDTAFYIAVADFDGDGNLDLAVADSLFSHVSILLGNGDGTFRPGPQDPPLPLSFKFIATGDFNGDGVPDLIGLPDSFFEGYTVLLGNGDGTFQAAQVTDMSFQVEAIAVGDFNKDGKVDVVAIGQSNITVMLGNGDGTFTQGANYVTELVPNKALTADFNGDHNLDVAISEGAGITVLLGKGDGTFRPQKSYAATFSSGVAVGDFNGDGKLDLASSQSDFSPGVDILLGNGDGTFQPAMFFPGGRFDTDVQAADFNLDGKTDVVLASRVFNGVIVMLNTGTVSLSPTSPLNFPFQLAGTTSSPLPVVLTNSGSATLSISSIRVNGPFSESNSCGATVAPDASCRIEVTFTPQLRGHAEGTVTITDSASSKPQVIDLLGGGTIVELAPSELDFPPQKVGTKSAPQTFTVTNAGTVAVNITEVYIGPDINYLNWTETNNCVKSLAPGASCTVSVVLDPLNMGVHHAAVYLVDDGGGSPQYVKITGSGD